MTNIPIPDTDTAVTPPGNDSFYTRMDSIGSLVAITDPSIYHDIPDDWLIALCDVRGSTRLVQEGRYKEVNAVAAAAITVMLNEIDVERPFVFGGDGATLLVPASQAQAAEHALLAVRTLAQQQFDITLRIGLIPVRDVLEEGRSVKVAKLLVSENFQQAIFAGGGLSYAESLLKHPVKGAQYQITSEETIIGDFSGFECRWDKVASRHAETVSLMVMDMSDDLGIYREVLEQIDAIYGDASVRHPISLKRMRVAFSPSDFSIEASIRSQDRSWRKLLRLSSITVGGMILMRYWWRTWIRYKHIVADATDREKFDDTLRMIISGSPEQRKRLRAYLETLRVEGRIVYGMHVSTHALMTCLVFDRFGRQVHFVDGADGGYALASQELKAQLNLVKSR